MNNSDPTMENLSHQNIEKIDDIEVLRQLYKEKEIVFENIIEGTLAGHWDWYITKNYEYLSPTFKSMFGYADNEMANHPDSWQKIIFQEDLPKIFAAFERHVKSQGKEPFDAEARYYHKNGSVVWVYCRGKVIEWDEQGNPLRAVGSHIDITKLKEAEEQEKKYSQQLETINRQLEQFAFVASHDLQEPLRTINSFSSLLKKNYHGQLDESADQYLNFITQSTKRMSSLIKGLLEYSRLGTNKQLSKVNMNKIIENVKNDLSLRISETNTTFKIDDLPEILGFETELRLLFQNLITNSIKFCKEGTAPHIEISTKINPSFYEFCFKDNGIGIEEQNAERIFNMFQRLHTVEEYDGTGIGLAHCQKIVALHGGKIWIRSEVGNGSSFYFTIRR